MGKASEAAHLASALTTRLLLASGKTSSAEQRLQDMALAFEIWPKLCRRMAEIELLAPQVAEIGYDYDAELMASLARNNSAPEGPAE